MLAQDEEVDIVEYRGYLTTQSDDDLCDIARHLDPERFPRRLEATQREMVRRRVLVGPVFTPKENAARYLALCIIAFCAATVLLALTMSPDEARAPQQPPSVNFDISHGLTASAGQSASGGESGMTASILGAYIWQNTQNVLRETVLALSRTGGYLVILGGTVASLTPWVMRRRSGKSPPRAVLVLLLSALACLVLTLGVCALSSVPSLVNGGAEVSGGFLARAVTLLAPWG
jgi:hypothetical protein